MNDLLKHIGNRLLHRRKIFAWHRRKLSEKAGITLQTIFSAELGKKALHPENIIRVCSTLKISNDYLPLGEVNANDHWTLISKISSLSPTQYRHLEDIINSFISALEVREALRWTRFPLCFLAVPKRRYGIRNQWQCRLIHFFLRLCSIRFLFWPYSYPFRHMPFLHSLLMTGLLYHLPPAQYLRNNIF